MCRSNALSADAFDSLGLETPFADGRAAKERFAIGAATGWESPFAEAEYSAFAFDHEAETPKADAKALDLKTAEAVTWEVIRLLNRQQDALSSDPDRAKNPPAWYRLYAPLLKEWHFIVHGKATDKGRTRLQGEALGTRIDSAFTMTRPILSILKQRGGRKWEKVLRDNFYRPMIEYEAEAIRTGPVTPVKPAIAPVAFALRPPQAVSLAQFFNTVAVAKGEPIPLQEYVGGAQVGWVKPGWVFKASNQDVRTVLWTGSLGVFFLRDDVIHAQSGSGFAHDIINGAFVVGAQNALGSMIMAQLMVEIALSFTPWGAVWDVVSAVKALSEGDWKGAALAALPGPALQIAGKTRAFRSVGRGVVIAAKFGARLASGGIEFIARGAYVLNGKMLRGVWLVGDAAGTPGVNSYRFVDEVAETIHDVPPAKARSYLSCSQCEMTAEALRLARKAEVQDITRNLLASPVYASRGKVLVNPKLIDDAIAAYGLDGGDVVRDILTAFETVVPAGKVTPAKLANDTLELAKTLSKVKSRHPQFRNIAVYQDAIDIFADLAAHPQTAVGAMYELQWAAKNVGQVASMGIPIYKKGWRGVGKGLDVLTKKGAAVELKNYNFTRWIYTDDPARSVGRIAHQAKLRLAYTNPAVTEVRFVFDSRTTMPREFRRMLEAELAVLTGSSGRNVSFEFWP